MNRLSAIVSASILCVTALLLFVSDKSIEAAALGVGAVAFLVYGMVRVPSRPVQKIAGPLTIASYAAERLDRGETLENVKNGLVAGGVDAKAADELLGEVLLSRTIKKWKSGIRGLILRSTGWIVMLIGLFLWLGNRKGFFSTFPFAGTIVVLVGVLLLIMGGGVDLSGLRRNGGADRPHS
jgi:hypothetical protein